MLNRMLMLRVFVTVSVPEWWRVFAFFVNNVAPRRPFSIYFANMSLVVRSRNVMMVEGYLRLTRDSAVRILHLAPGCS